MIITNGKNRIKFLFLLLAVLLAACGKSDGDYREQTPSYTVDPQAESLTVAGPGKEASVYTKEELQELGVTVRTYSGRGKEKKNARQFLEFSGVDLGVLLEDAGCPRKDASMKVFCSDGYVREYDLEELFDRYAYEDDAGNACRQINPMIAVADGEDGWEYPAPFRLVYGQADYDTGKSMDFNMQGWASYVQYIEVGGGDL